ncbi:MAG: class I SAM-dependent methyltransferase [Candidatus Omnitrophota bacterium]
MLKNLDIDFILELYRKYSKDLKRVRKQQLAFYRNDIIYSEAKRIFAKYLRHLGIRISDSARLSPHFDDIEAEITYLLVRESRPETIVEFSPCGGWSTAWILHALKDNKFGKLYSYDMIDASRKTVPHYLSRNRWSFILGDIKNNIDKLPAKIDYLFIDSDHSKEFAQWYIQHIFPMIKNNIPVSVDDVFHTSDPSEFCGEGGVIVDWLERKKINYVTASPAKAIDNFNRIVQQKNELGISALIHTSINNAAIFFHFKTE